MEGLGLTVGSPAWFESVTEFYGDVLKADGFDDCVIGVAKRCGQEPVLVYDQGKVIQKLVREGLTFEEAVEHFDFNIAGAWVGDQTPFFVVR